jgi:hypothetical protein
MARTHPHAEASYRVIRLADGAFAVEVSIPDSSPTRVTKFASEADAEAWIVQHQHRVEAEGQSGRWFRRDRPTRPFGSEPPGPGRKPRS